MNVYAKGLLAGLIATVALSVLMFIKGALGIMPQFNVIQMLSGALGAPNAPIVGWLAHFLIGTVAWGLLFAWMADSLPGSYWWRGAVFATGAWLLMMLLFMPAVGAGLFGLHTGAMVPLITLILHWVYGLILGGTFGATGHDAEQRFATQR